MREKSKDSLQSLKEKQLYDKVIVLVPDGAGSKGDEAMIRGIFNLFSGKKIELFTPRNELWKGWIIDRGKEFEESYYELDDIINVVNEPVHMVIIGADVMDGLYGKEDTLRRLNIAEKVINCGGRVDVFSCSFRANVELEILEKIVNIGNRVQFYLRDRDSLYNFEKQTGLQATFFPDLAFLCEGYETERTDRIKSELDKWKKSAKDIVAINFSEHSFKGFYKEISDENREKYVKEVVDALTGEFPSMAFVAVPHDTRSWPGHYEDMWFSKLFHKYMREVQRESDLLVLDEFMTESELLEILGKVDIAISGRMHLTIAGIRNAVIPIGYMGMNEEASFINIEKFRGMFKERIERENLVLGSCRDLVALLKDILPKKEAMKEEIATKNGVQEELHQKLINNYRVQIGLPAIKINAEGMCVKHEIKEDAVREYIAQRERLVKSNTFSFWNEKDKIVSEYQMKIRELEEQIRKKEKTFSQESKSRLFVKLLKKCIKHPIYMMKKCTPSRIARTLRYMCTGDTSMLAEYLQVGANGVGEEIERIPLELEPVVDAKSSIAEYERIVLPKSDNPLVSIIIPAYNQFYYTYNCLKSIAKHTDGVEYEVILADDCSTDLTASITDVVENIVIAKTPVNMRFLRNCNSAVKQAKGEYIFFLNNDTQVLEGWLTSLLELITNDKTIGMVGSKLLYPDGALQEAGGIVWKDASAWNFGKQHGPREAEFNYVRETDYISGAACMIRHSLWKEIGGFDERFAPAYYEDTDLAMEVRAHGYKVVYQPLSMVVHFEGISNGTDISSGQKAYQIVNQKKFYDKWKEVLKKEHFANGEDIFLAKDRSRRKKHILVVDHYVPKHDKDAGGKCTYMYLKLFVKLGMKVTFIGDNFYPEQPYTQELNQMGIEVLYGNYYANNWKKWLKKNAHYFDYIYLQRPHISIKYIDIVKANSHAKIFYFAHDLHHIREYREYELTGNEKKLKSSEKWKKIEYELFEKTDVGHVVGSYEQQMMQEVFPDKPIRNIPLYIYEKQLDDINKDFSTREHIMYVGGFGHPPNIDAVLWFGKEVFPKILETYPTMKWYVVGSKVPAEIQALASDNIIITGFLPDAELDEVYRKCRMAIVPLRVGAGVKGKVVEAAYYQLPLVTTTIGAEGLDDKVGNMVVENDADAMSDLIIKLYEDYATLKDMSDAGRMFVDKYFMLNEAERVIRADVEI